MTDSFVEIAERAYPALAGDKRPVSAQETLTSTLPQPTRVGVVCCVRRRGYPSAMTKSDESGTREHEEDVVQAESAAGGDRPSAGDPEHNTTPPGNPETDDEAVAKGEDTLGRITGR
jgi:hypothetical protein